MFGWAYFLYSAAAYSLTAQDTQQVNVTIDSVNEVGISGSIGTLTLSSATIGQSTFSTTSSNLNLAYTTNDTKTKKIIGWLDTAMPSNTSLYINVSAPTSGGSSLGEVALSTTPSDLVSSVPGQTKETGINFYFKFESNLQAGVLSQFSRVVTITITDN